MPGVTFIPSNISRTDSDNIKALVDSQSPLKLFLADVAILFQNLWYFPSVVRPLRLAKCLPGVKYDYYVIYRDGFITLALFALQLSLFLLAVPAYCLFSGLHVSAFVIGNLVLTRLMSGQTWGSLRVQSQVVLPQIFEDEQWIFINGIATTHGMLQTTCDMLSATFKRPIIGIHNTSYGFFGDLIECLVQRCLSYHNRDTRIAYECIWQSLQTKKKVVIIAHSQGGIVTSLVLDRLYTHASPNSLAKLEVYTFGSAAATFHNPLKIANLDDTSSPHEPDLHDHSIPVIEHYCNEFDMVPRWGVLYHVNKASSGSYSGKVFIHQRQTGHLFDQHYLEPMFPLAYADSDDLKCFLNHQVVEERISPVMKASTIPITRSGGSGLNIFTMKKVKDCSRLWKYMDGRSP